jgi:phage terminase small subunit
MLSLQRVDAFCCHYVSLGNGTEAYIQAFPHARRWKRRSAARKAVDLMKRPDVLARIEALQIVMREKRNAAFVAELEAEFDRTRRDRLDYLDRQLRGSNAA